MGNPNAQILFRLDLEEPETVPHILGWKGTDRIGDPATGQRPLRKRLGLVEATPALRGRRELFNVARDTVPGTRVDVRADIDRFPTVAYPQPKQKADINRDRSTWVLLPVRVVAVGGGRRVCVCQDILLRKLAQDVPVRMFEAVYIHLPFGGAVARQNKSLRARGVESPREHSGGANTGVRLGEGELVGRSPHQRVWGG